MKTRYAVRHRAVRSFALRLGRYLNNELYGIIFARLPRPIGSPIRIAWVRRYGASIGRDCYIGVGVRMLGVERLTVGDRVSIPYGTCIDARGGLQLCDDALIGFESIILTATHNSDDPDRAIQEQGMFEGPVVIGPRAWLGTRVILQPGVTIGEGAIVGSGAVVTKDVAAFDVVAGVPARVIRNRRTDRSTA
jgi:acetyltransferase-like isoleucine patch superfamily enzyme